MGGAALSLPARGDCALTSGPESGALTCDANRSNDNARCFSFENFMSFIEMICLDLFKQLSARCFIFSVYSPALPGASSSRCAAEADLKAKPASHATKKVVRLPISAYQVHAIFVQ